MRGLAAHRISAASEGVRSRRRTFRWDATTDHCFVPYSLTSRINISSSSFVHGPLLALLGPVPWAGDLVEEPSPLTMSERRRSASAVVGPLLASISIEFKLARLRGDKTLAIAHPQWARRSVSTTRPTPGRPQPADPSFVLTRLSRIGHQLGTFKNVVASE